MKLSRTLIMAAIAVAGTAQAAQVTLFKQPNFSGEALTLHSDTDDLSGSHFQDQVSSVVVRSGRWQVCTMPNFQGNCSVLGPGRYATLDQDLNHRIESVRELAGYAVNDCGDRNANCGPRYYGYAERDHRFQGYDSRNDARDERGWSDHRDSRYDGDNRYYDNSQDRGAYGDRWSNSDRNWSSGR